MILEGRDLTQSGITVSTAPACSRWPIEVVRKRACLDRKLEWEWATHGILERGGRMIRCQRQFLPSMACWRGCLSLIKCGDSTGTLLPGGPGRFVCVASALRIQWTLQDVQQKSNLANDFGRSRGGRN